MRTLLFALLVQSVQAVTLTYLMKSTERACFYTMATAVNEKIAFYFAVQSGGAFDIDWDVVDPNGKHIMSGDKERQADYVFAAKVAGEYSLCFSNGAASFEDKLIDFDLSVGHEAKSDITNPSNNLPSPMDSSHSIQKSMEDSVKPLRNMLEEIGTQLISVQKHQKHFRTRENRNFSTVKSTEDRIFWFSVTECLLIIAVAVIQVVVLQGFFAGKQSGLRV